ncbi:hypothetical protein SK854_42765 [Lentzea sp. BCCO 10_0061]|uniref:Uncharacterized protein n=1 Tax=Lentzea sokolovensis TaxID=3095429 RepID=A0ABU4VAR8_9PSEU|nr:hypothetical protein [Lentzea sp. BCCO 10_0061]MDX8148902.1 hypothetical protein [Lentzea sp. BCCO 10_0061]
MSVVRPTVFGRAAGRLAIDVHVTRRRVLTGLAAAGLVLSALGAGSATAATKGKTYRVRVPAGNRDVTILDLGGKAHRQGLLTFA